MKEKNKKLIIIVSCLLVVIGVSLAYFAASSFVGGNGTEIEATTATIKGSELIVEGSLSFNDLDVYPGHQNVSSIKLTATGDNVLIPYNVIWEGTNTLNTPINYTVYKTTSEMDVSASCNKVIGNMGASRIYYEECSISNIDALGSIISTGTIENGNTKVTLIPDEFITSSLDGEVVYYYVILEYPNLDESQNIDIGGTFSGEITIEENEVTSDLTIAGIYIENNGEYQKATNIPEEGYTLNTEESTCNNNASIGWDSEEEQIYVSNLNTTNTECTLYFDEHVPTAGETILVNYPTKLTRDDFSTTLTNTTTGTIYYEDTSKGRTYYFAGNPTDNWVQFGGFYWRIIRINEDGTIRMIYQGTSINTNASNASIGTSSFNSANNNNMYVGYMYQNEQVHGLTSNSTIKGVLDTWFQNNLMNEANKIDGNAGFCNDRTLYSGSGIGTSTTYYAAYNRLVNNKQPSFECSNSSDLFTTTGSANGNKSLQYPIGLITADEIAYAGGVQNTINNQFYLYTETDYWTITPYSYPTATGFTMNYIGNFDFGDMRDTLDIRPVINLRADLNLSGSGTSTDPYRIA